jgi:hypothetical protein
MPTGRDGEVTTGLDHGKYRIETPWVTKAGTRDISHCLTPESAYAFAIAMLTMMIQSSTNPMPNSSPFDRQPSISPRRRARLLY